MRTWEDNFWTSKESDWNCAMISHPDLHALHDHSQNQSLSQLWRLERRWYFYFRWNVQSTDCLNCLEAGTRRVWFWILNKGSSRAFLKILTAFLAFKECHELYLLKRIKKLLILFIRFFFTFFMRCMGRFYLIRFDFLWKLFEGSLWIRTPCVFIYLYHWTGILRLLFIGTNKYPAKWISQLNKNILPCSWYQRNL